jgi:drug/metabolite transporter (DMT)-like permease
VILALLAHSGFGLWVVVVKHLLDYLPPFRLSAVAYSVAVPVTFLIARRHITWDDFRRPDLWLLSGITLVRSVCKLLALQLTFATYVQLLDLIIPFIAPILAWLWLRERMPRGTLVALAATGLGSFLVIARDPLAVQLPNGPSDVMGIGLVLASATAMAAAIVHTRYLTGRKLNPVATFFQPAIAVGLTYWVLSGLTGESWQPFVRLQLANWMFYAVFIVVSLIGGGLIQALAISRTNASLYATLLSWRLGVALAAGWLLLGEGLTTLWQAAGVIMVVVAITLYVRHQDSRQHAVEQGMIE